VVASVVLFAVCTLRYYTVRLMYVSLSASNISQHRQSGMYIGAVAFLTISLMFG
jgi:hypothetical protein